ncbi:unnamed protein product [Somion occarium]|uniref:Uncharacterized protein n=1 Tax=Somion occarium TaxID=3059160 RepID=A0ABP1E4K1_9APHY
MPSFGWALTSDMNFTTLVLAVFAAVVSVHAYDPNDPNSNPFYNSQNRDNRPYASNYPGYPPFPGFGSDAAPSHAATPAPGFRPFGNGNNLNSPNGLNNFGVPRKRANGNYDFSGINNAADVAAGSVPAPTPAPGPAPGVYPGYPPFPGFGSSTPTTTSTTPFATDTPTPTFDNEEDGSFGKRGVKFARAD